MSRISYPAARTETPTLFAAMSPLKVDLGNRWRILSTAELTPEDWEQAAWEVARLAEAAVADESVSVRAAAALLAAPDASWNEEIQTAGRLIHRAIDFHERQADWFRDRRQDVARLGDQVARIADLARRAAEER
jgi:hypothetical protein